MPNGCYRHSMPFLALATPKNECLVPHSRHSSTLYSSQVRCSCTVAWFPMFHFHTFHYTVLSLQIPMISTSMWFANCQLSRFLNASKWRPRSLFPPPRLLLVVGFLRPFCARGMDPARPARQDMRWFLKAAGDWKRIPMGPDYLIFMYKSIVPFKSSKSCKNFWFLHVFTDRYTTSLGLLFKLWVAWLATASWLAGWPAGMSYWIPDFLAFGGWWKNPTRQQTRVYYSPELKYMVNCLI